MVIGEPGLVKFDGDPDVMVACGLVFLWFVWLIINSFSGE